MILRVATRPATGGATVSMISAPVTSLTWASTARRPSGAATGTLILPLTPTPNPTPILTLILPLTPTLPLIRCNYWDDDTRAWSSEGCTSKGVTEVNGCANPALGVEDPITGVVERRLTEASSSDVLSPFSPPPPPPFPRFPSAAPPTIDPNIACAYALRCECTHLTDFGGVAIPTSLDEVLAQLEPTITLPCPDGFFAPYEFMESPFLYSLIKVSPNPNLPLPTDY